MIELKGLGPANKGAHLMLLSILDEFKRRESKEVFCIEPRAGMDHLLAGKMGLYMKENLKGRRIPWSTLFALLPQKTLKNYGLILDGEIDIVLDGSGFAYGDFWGYQKIEQRLQNYLNGKTKKGSKLILLPQALGPFNDPKVKKAFERVVNVADLIFARDDVSYQHLLDNYGEQKNFRKAPDFTNLLFSGESLEYPEGDICIIPNYKMVDSEESKVKYYTFLETAVKHTLEKGEKPYFLIHEGVKDLKIAKDINKSLQQNLDIVYIEDALEIKNRIKSAKLIVVSRFHGLVSGLSQGIPSITTSWSHKYKELVKGYGLENTLIDISTYNSEDLHLLINNFLEKETERHYQDQKPLIDKEKAKSRAMWDEVFELINK